MGGNTIVILNVSKKIKVLYLGLEQTLYRHYINNVTTELKFMRLNFQVQNWVANVMTNRMIK